MSTKKRIGDLMVARGLIDRTQAESIAVARVCAEDRFASVAVREGAVSEADALEVLANHAGVPAADLARAIIPASVSRLLPQGVAIDACVLPVARHGEHLVLAMLDPSAEGLVQEVEFSLGVSVLPHVALHSRLRALIAAAYGSDAPLIRGPDADPDRAGEDGYVPIVSGVSEVDDFEFAAPDEDEPLSLLAPHEAVAQSGAQTPPAESPDDARSAGTVLVVEDDPDIQRLIAATMKSLGHRVFCAGRGLEALQLIKSTRPDLVILDAMLPEVHGFEICRKLKSSTRFAKTPVLMVSAVYKGWRVADDIRKTYRVDDFLEKPFRIEELKRRVQSLLEHGMVAEDGAPVRERIENCLREVEKAFANKDYDRALEQLRVVEGLEPFSAKVQGFLGRVLEQKGKAFQAIFHYERACEMAPTDFSTHCRLAALYESRGFRNKAIDVWAEAERHAPDEPTGSKIRTHRERLL